jgi:hypothetical protein
LKTRTPTLKFVSCFALKRFGPQEEYFQAFSPARSGWIAPGRTRVYEHAETGKPLEWKDLSSKSKNLSARQGRADFSGGTAPERLATNSLQSGHHAERLAWLVRKDKRYNPRSLPPPGAGSSAAAVTLAPDRFYAHPPSPPGITRLHPTLPRVPAALSCRTEGYDGKRDLHLQHAA